MITYIIVLIEIEHIIQIMNEYHSLTFLFLSAIINIGKECRIWLI